jgi:CDP-paratose 2-epimerase
MSVAVITGSAGLIGSEASAFFAGMGLDVVGIDNDMRKTFFGEEASTSWNRDRLAAQLGRHYRHLSIDIRDSDAIDRLFGDLGSAAKLIVHTAAQPSHDWAARAPQVDFHVNAVGTLNLLEATRKHAPEAVFIFTSTNKVYGDLPNRLPLVEQELRFEIQGDHPYATGIREDMSIDQSMHSVFGASKIAADVLVQEYGRYFGMRTACFRGGCLTGPNHAGTQLHGFLSYLMKCAMSGACYTVYGYRGKQVRDNIHSADLIAAFREFFLHPRAGEVYNIGGGRFSNCSVLEAIAMCEALSGREMKWDYDDRNRAGDHIWWISDTAKFQGHYPNWTLQYSVPLILEEIRDANLGRRREEHGAHEPAAMPVAQPQSIDTSG